MVTLQVIQTAFVGVELTHEDAELFKAFRKYQDDFAILLKAGVMDFKNGQATMTRDADGTLKDIDLRLRCYVRRKALDKSQRYANIGIVQREGTQT